MHPIEFFARNTGLEPRVKPENRDRMVSGVTCPLCGRNGDAVRLQNRESSTMCLDCLTIRQAYPTRRLVSGHCVVTETGCDFWTKLDMAAYSPNIRWHQDGSASALLRGLILTPPRPPFMVIMFGKSNKPSSLVVNETSDILTITGLEYWKEPVGSINVRMVTELLLRHPTVDPATWGAAIRLVNALYSDSFTKKDQEKLNKINLAFPGLLQERLPLPQSPEHCALMVASEKV